MTDDDYQVVNPLQINFSRKSKAKQRLACARTYVPVYTDVKSFSGEKKKTDATAK